MIFLQISANMEKSIISVIEPILVSFSLSLSMLLAIRILFVLRIFFVFKVRRPVARIPGIRIGVFLILIRGLIFTKIIYGRIE